MRRREFMSLAGSAALAWPVAARGQQARKWRVGFLHPGRLATANMRMIAFQEGLGTPSDRDNAEVDIISRLTDENFDQLPTMAAELLRHQVEALCAVSPPAVRAARDATRSAPIIAVDLESDPVASGWAASLARPGGNVTGIFLDLPDFSAKCLQLLLEAVPGQSRIAVLWHPAVGTLQLEAARSASDALNVTLEVFEIREVPDFENVFRAIAHAGNAAVLMLSSPLISGNPKLLATLALRHRFAVINQYPDFAESGGLLGYGPDLQQLFRQAGALMRKVLQAPAGADLPPLERPVRFRLIANLQTAKVLGITVPPTLLARADEVIE